MGSRNLIVILSERRYRIAQYCHYGADPQYNGVSLLQKLACANLNELRSSLKCVRLHSDETEAGMNADLHTGPDLLNILRSNFLVGDTLHFLNSLPFMTDPSCEWLWLIDLDAGTFEGYMGGNTWPLTMRDRFKSFDKPAMRCHPPKLAIRYMLDALPDRDTFLSYANQLDFWMSHGHPYQWYYPLIQNHLRETEPLLKNSKPKKASQATKEGV